MNKQIGKLLVFGGFTLKMCLAAYSYLATILSFSKGSLLRSLLRLLTGEFISVLYRLASLGAVLAIVAGFVVMFLAGRSVTDLLLGILFAFDLRTPFAALTSGRMSSYATVAGDTHLDFLGAYLNNHDNVATSVTLWIILLIWSFKFLFNGNKLGYSLIWLGMMGPFITPLFGTLAVFLIKKLELGIAISKLIFFGVLSIPTICAAALAFATFLDLQRE